MSGPIPAQKKRVLIVAGEASGDLHGSNLIRAAAEITPELSFFGVAGARMRDVGCEAIFPAEDLSVMGLSEVIRHLPVIKDRFRRLEKILRGTDRPDLLLLVDYPGFNLRLAKVAHQVGIPVLYYIAPKVWAWKKGRIKTIGERIDRLALIFPFEPKLYAAEDVQASYVGNPLLDEYAAEQPLNDLRKEFRIEEDATVIGLFPGSRRSELSKMFGTLLETAKWIRERKPEARFVVPIAPSLDRAELEAYLEGSDLPVELSTESIYSVASACDAVLCVSGTVTLQTALCHVPMAVLYKAATLSYLVGKMVVKIPHFSLVNIVAGREVVREFLQHAAEPRALGQEILRLLDDASYREHMINGLGSVCEALGEPGSSRRVALMAADMCREKV